MKQKKQTKRKPSDTAQAIRIQVLQRATERLNRSLYVPALLFIFYSLSIGVCLGVASTATSNIESMFFTVLSLLALGLVVASVFIFIQKLKAIDGLQYTIKRISKDIYGEKMWDHEPKTR